MFPKIVLGVFFIASSTILSHHVNAQDLTGGQPAQNWADKEFTPNIKNGAVHLRLGRGGPDTRIAISFRTEISRGDPSCDLAYLFYIKGGKKMPQGEREACALNEYKFANFSSYESQAALNNSFNKARAIESYLPVVDSRIEFLSQAKRFYIRTSVEVKSVDPKTMVGDFRISLTDQNSQIGAGNVPIMMSARGSGLGLFEPLQPLPASLAQRLEESRVANLIDAHRGEVYFDITSVVPANFSDRTNHLLLIENIQYRMYFYTTNKEYRTIANF